MEHLKGPKRRRPVADRERGERALTIGLLVALTVTFWYLDTVIGAITPLL